MCFFGDMCPEKTLLGLQTCGPLARALPQAAKFPGKGSAFSRKGKKRTRSEDRVLSHYALLKQIGSDNL